MKRNQEDMDFTQAEVEAIQNSHSADDARLAKSMGITKASIRAMRRYLGAPHTKSTAAKRALTLSAELDGTTIVKKISVPELKNKLIIRHGNSSILLDKTEVGGVTFDGSDIIIHHYK